MEEECYLNNVGMPRLLQDIYFPLKILFIKSSRVRPDTFFDCNLGAKEVTMENSPKGARPNDVKGLEI